MSQAELHAVTDDLIALLNELLYLDCDWLNELISVRPLCNIQVAKHPTVQVQTDSEQQAYRCGILGVLNGLCGVMKSGPKEGWGPITAETDESGKIVRFRRTE